MISPNRINAQEKSIGYVWPALRFPDAVDAEGVLKLFHGSIRMKGTRTSLRKQEHIRICLEKDVEFSKSNGFERYEFEHRALPEINLSDINTSTTFLGRKFELPFFIEPMTGGSPCTEKMAPR